MGCFKDPLGGAQMCLLSHSISLAAVGWVGAGLRSTGSFSVVVGPLSPPVLSKRQLSDGASALERERWGQARPISSPWALAFLQWSEGGGKPVGPSVLDTQLVLIPQLTSLLALSQAAAQ